VNSGSTALTSRGRRAAASGEFALPKTITPALPAVEAFADLDMPEQLLASLTVQGMRVPFPIQGATLPNTLAGRDVLGRGRTGCEAPCRAVVASKPGARHPSFGNRDGSAHSFVGTREGPGPGA
jgi:hypothetical protein